MIKPDETKKKNKSFNELEAFPLPFTLRNEATRELTHRLYWLRRIVKDILRAF